MVLKRPDAPAKQRKGINKLTLGFASVGAAAVIGTAGIAAAAPTGKPTKAECAAKGFTNYGQCVKEWAHMQGNGGYGGGNTINTNVNVSVPGSNNVITIILRFLFH